MITGKLILCQCAFCSGLRSRNALLPNLPTRTRAVQQPLLIKLLPLLLLLCTLSLTEGAPSSALTSKPVPTDPPWPLGCQWEVMNTLCGLLY